MNKEFVEIDKDTILNLKKIAKENGFTSVDELLTAFAKNFSTGCSVTLSINDFISPRSMA